MKFIRIKKNNRNQPELITKTNFFGELEDTKAISKRKCVLITGLHDSGKTKIVNKLYDNCEAIWRTQVQPYRYSRDASLTGKPMLKQGESLEDWKFHDPIMLNCVAPMSKWYAADCLAMWFETDNPGEKFKSLPAWKRSELIADYLKATRAILFVDDAHKATGTKLRILKMCLESAYIAVMTTTDENRLSPSIRKPFLERKPQIVRLNTEVAYDATHALMWFVVVMFFVLGSPEIATAIGLFEVLKGGKRASKET